MDMRRRLVAAGLIGRAAFFVAFGLAVCSTSSAFAQTAEQRAACTPDAMRLCASAIPDIGRVTACMQANRARLSPRCQAAMPGAPSATQLAAQPRPDRVATMETPRRGGVAGRHRRLVTGAAASGSHHRRHVAAGGFGFGGRGSRQGMTIALQVMSALSAACQNPGTSSQLCGVTNGLMGSMGSLGGAGGMGGIGALAGFMK